MATFSLTVSPCQGAPFTVTGDVGSGSHQDAVDLLDGWRNPPRQGANYLVDDPQAPGGVRHLYVSEIHELRLVVDGSEVTP